MSWLINAQRNKEDARKPRVDHRQRLAALRASDPTKFLHMPDHAESVSVASSPSAAEARLIATAAAVERVNRLARRRRKQEHAFSQHIALSNTILGTGAFGVVYLGVHQTTGAWVAVKKLQIRPQGASDNASAVKTQLDEMAEEIRLMKHLEHPNVVRYLHAENNNTELSIFMEYMSGGSMASLLKRFDKLPEPMIRTYMAQAITGVAFLHQRNIVHRDIKADNILLHADGTAKLSDFGTSREVTDSANLLTVTGTPWFMAPEVVKGTGHGAAADIWSLGCTMIQLASGVAPFSDFTNPVTAMYNVALHPSKVLDYIPSHCSPTLRGCLELCLQEHPQSRPSAAELLSHGFFTAEPPDSASDESTSGCSSPESSPPVEGLHQTAAAGFSNVVGLHGVQVAARVPTRPTTPSMRAARLREETQNQQGASAVHGPALATAHQ